MDNFWEIFKQISAIPRCSGDTKHMREFIGTWAKEQGYKVKSDKAGNIIALHPKSTLTLQAHYDMVCMGDAPKIELIEKQGKMMAKNSSLGADNGIGVVLMLEAMQKQLPVDCLFTADEEIGLVGANNLELKIETNAVINLDSEESEAVFVACAGGMNMNATLKLKKLYNKEGKCFRLSVDNLPGGHSGVDIDKNISNANIELTKTLMHYQLKLVDIQGGERRNSISKSASAVFMIEEGDTSSFETLECQGHGYYYENSETIVRALANMPHGVKKHNRHFDIPDVSINFATMKIEDDQLQVGFSLRSMDEYGMDVLEGQVKHYLETLGFKVRTEGKYLPWASDKNAFTQRLADVVEEVEGFVAHKAIHAGLECAVLQKKARKIDFVSIGPDIFNPHSIREYVDMGSVERFRKIVYKFIESEQNFEEEIIAPTQNGTRDKRPKRK